MVCWKVKSGIVQAVFTKNWIVMVEDGIYDFVVVKCSAPKCSRPTVLDRIPIGPVLGLKTVSWVCSSCGGDYCMTGNEIITRCAKELGTFSTYKQISHSVSDESPNNVDPQIEEVTPENFSREGVYSYVLIKCAKCSQVNSVPNLRVGGSGGQEKRDWRCMACHNIGFITGDQLGSRSRFDVIELGQWRPTQLSTRGTKTSDGPKDLSEKRWWCSCGSGILYKNCCGKPEIPPDSYRNDLSQKNMGPDHLQSQQSQSGPSRASCWWAFFIGVIVAALIHQPLAELYLVAGGNPYAVGLVQSFIFILPLAPWLYLLNKRSSKNR